MKNYLNKVKRLIKKFKEVSFLQVLREENMEADALAKAASVDGSMDELDEVQYMPSIDLPEVQQIEGEENWMTQQLLTLGMEGFQKKGRSQKTKDQSN